MNAPSSLFKLQRFEDLDLATAPAVPPGPVVMVLCAAWCGVCRGFEAATAGVGEDFPLPASWAWIDVEDAADALPSLDVETFPTLAVFRGKELRFFGPILPEAGLLRRSVRAALEGEGRPALPEGFSPAEGQELLALAGAVAHQAG